MTKATRHEMQKWANDYHGCVFTALSNLAGDWETIAKAKPKPGEEWIQDMARQQAKRYSDALLTFEMLF